MSSEATNGTAWNRSTRGRHAGYVSLSFPVADVRRRSTRARTPSVVARRRRSCMDRADGPALRCGVAGRPCAPLERSEGLEPVATALAACGSARRGAAPLFEQRARSHGALISTSRASRHARDLQRRAGEVVRCALGIRARAAQRTEPSAEHVERVQQDVGIGEQERQRRQRDTDGIADPEPRHDRK